MRYRLDSLLPLRAFSPRSGRARGFAAGGMTLEGDGGQQYWQDTPAPAPDPCPSPAPAPDTSSPSPVQTGPSQGGGGVDQNQLNQLYEQYLGRGVDTSGASTWAGQCVNQVIAGITGSGITQFKGCFKSIFFVGCHLYDDIQ